MGLGSLLRRIVGTRAVTVDDLLSRDDVARLLEEYLRDWDSHHDLIIITRNGDKDLRWFLDGPCKADDLRAVRMLWDTLGDIL